MLTGPTRLCRPCLPAEPAHAAATAGFSILEGEIPGETDCLLEGSGFELPVPRCALVAYSAALVAPPDSAVSGSSLNGRLTTPIGGGPETARLTRREDRSAQPGCGPENLVIGRPLEGNSSVRLPATCVCRRNWLPRRIKRADCGPHGPGDLGNVGLSRLSTGRRRG